MKTQESPPEYLALDEINPSVDLGSFFKVQDVWYTYRIPGHHVLLIKSGHMEAKTPHGAVSGRAGDLICFRPTEHNEYGTKGDLAFYQIHIDFAPPPRENLTPWLDDAGPLPVHLPLGESFEPVRNAFETILLELEKEGAVHRLRVRAAVFDILSNVAGQMAGRPAEPTRLDPWHRARLLLGVDLGKELRLEELARPLGIGRDHFIRRAQCYDQFVKSEASFLNVHPGPPCPGTL